MIVDSYQHLCYQVLTSLIDHFPYASRVISGMPGTVGEMSGTVGKDGAPAGQPDGAVDIGSVRLAIQFAFFMADSVPPCLLEQALQCG